MRPGNQKGIALIVVLLIASIVIILSTEMAGRLQLNVKRAANIKDSNQAYWYAMGAEQYATIAINKLVEDAKGVIHINQAWAKTNLTFPLPNGGIQAELVDMQSCFNLNAMQVQQTQGSANQSIPAAFHRLLTNPEYKIPSLEADTLKDSLVDWLDEDSNLSGSFGAEDPDYESKPFPYLAANNLMVNKTELRLVNGAKLPWLTQLMPLVCAIPGVSVLKINVNTLTPEHAPLLAALTGMTISTAENVIGSIPYDTKEEFINQPEVAAQGLTDEQKDWFDVTTQYFILYTKASYNNATFAMSSVFKIDNAESIKVIRREFGGKL
ncbi:type II secretion system minor pseudopilin GspK [Paraneptunicella aestuarii]|uniref:type II secretion system minor pseudopilin GspK n=1 Tax=Paraneptunicella aestuarii TaxID=2831148 RepID=UPI001E533D27|nr:type II secretion system minor pseudopilin GspK [Paraneptunicella aestuarii]UAA38908.1 type II secretion system minor pseudopilin GspK [Paraneptunicella aestuarii]